MSNMVKSYNISLRSNTSEGTQSFHVLCRNNRIFRSPVQISPKSVNINLEPITLNDCKTITELETKLRSSLRNHGVTVQVSILLSSYYSKFNYICEILKDKFPVGTRTFNGWFLDIRFDFFYAKYYKGSVEKIEYNGSWRDLYYKLKQHSIISTDDEFERFAKSYQNQSFKI